jgi:hypothetical protein
VLSIKYQLSRCHPTSAKKDDIIGIQGSKEKPMPVSKVNHSFGHNGWVAEKVACKTDRVTPASSQEVALLAGVKQPG